MNRILNLTLMNQRCALFAAFFMGCVLTLAPAQSGLCEEALGVFSSAPENVPAPKIEPPRVATPAAKIQTPADSKEDPAVIAVVVDLKKAIQIVDEAPPPPVEAVLQEISKAGPKAKPSTPHTLAGARNFKQLIELPDEQFDLAECILALGAEPGFELSETSEKTLKRLDDMAARAKEQLPATPDVSDYFDALYDVVLNRRPVEALHDERDEDFDLSRAVFQHRGSCLSLGIAALAVAHRLNAPVISGTQCPNHFFLRGTGVVKGHDVALSFDVTRPTPDNWTKLDDNFYRKWRHFDSKAEDAGEYLRPMTPKQVVSAFLASRAGFLSRERKFEEALIDADRALALNPRNVNALINAGYVKESLRDLEQAENYYKQALDVDPQSIRALNNLAFVKARDKKSSVFDAKKAEKLIEQAIKIDPDQAYLYATRAEIYAAMGDYRDATRSMQTAVSLSPKNASYRERYMSLREFLRSTEAR